MQHLGSRQAAPTIARRVTQAPAHLARYAKYTAPGAYSRSGRHAAPIIPDSGPQTGILPSSRVRSLAQRWAAVTQNIG